MRTRPVVQHFLAGQMREGGTDGDNYRDDDGGGDGDDDGPQYLPTHNTANTVTLVIE